MLSYTYACMFNDTQIHMYVKREGGVDGGGSMKAYTNAHAATTARLNSLRAGAE